MDCPTCTEAMDEGQLAMNGVRLTLASAVWEPAGPSFRSKQVLRPGPLGLHTRPAWRCPSCGTVLIPPDERDDRIGPYPGRSLVHEGERVSEPSKEPVDTAPPPPPASWESFVRDDDDPLRG